METALLVTDRLLIGLPDQEMADNILSFYIRNKQFFDKREPKKPKDFYSTDYHKRALTKNREEFEKGFSTRLWIFLKENKAEPIGYVSVQRIIRTDDTACATIGYSLGEEYCHNGYMTEALERILYLLFDDYKLQRIMAYISEDNTSSIGVVKRLGFEKEGITRSYIYIKGKWVDHICFSIIRPEELGELNPDW